MLALVAIWAFAEALAWFVVADVPIMALAARQGRRAGMQAAFLATLCAALGGVAMFLWAASDPAGSLEAILALPGIDAALYEAEAAHWRSEGLGAMVAGSFSGVPYKIYAHGAGAGGADLAVFALDSLFARAPRFILVAALAGWLGPVLRRRLGERNFWLLFAAAWTAFYAWYWTALG